MPRHAAHAETRGERGCHRVAHAARAQHRGTLGQLQILVEGFACRHVPRRARARRRQRAMQLGRRRQGHEAADHRHARIALGRIFQQAVQARLHLRHRVGFQIHRDGIDVRQGKPHVRKLLPQLLDQRVVVGSQKIVDAVHENLDDARAVRQHAQQLAHRADHLPLVGA